MSLNNANTSSQFDWDLGQSKGFHFRKEQLSYKSRNVNIKMGSILKWKLIDWLQLIHDKIALKS